MNKNKTSPYVRLRSSFISRSTNYSFKRYHTSRWSDYDLNDINIFYNNPLRISQSLIYIEILSKQSISSNDILAYGVISLAQLNIVDKANRITW